MYFVDVLSRRGLSGPWHFQGQGLVVACGGVPISAPRFDNGGRSRSEGSSLLRIDTCG